MIIFSLEFPAETGREVWEEQKRAKIKIAILSLGPRNVGVTSCLTLLLSVSNITVHLAWTQHQYSTKSQQASI